MERQRSAVNRLAVGTTRTLINTIFFLLLSTAAWAASPVIFYSDLTAGPKTGGQNNNGVFVTIWGNNFGTTQGSSTVTVGGGTVANYQTWTNTMICFQLGANAATGNIVLNTSNGNATGPAFTVQAGNIYFVQPGAASNGSGTYASPFNHLYYAEQKVVAGDTVYVEAGTIQAEEDGHPGWHTLLMPETAGTQSSPISWVAYPNASIILIADGSTATWTDGASGGSDNISYAFRGYSNWQTFSKFTLQMPGNSAISLIDSTGSDGWKVVGNNFTSNSYSYCQLCLAGNYSSALGNEIHDSGAGINSGNEEHSIYWDGGGTNVEIAWNYMHGNMNTGWEISTFHQGSTSEPTRVGIIHDNLIVAPSAGAVKGILLGDVDNGENQQDVWAQVIKVYNNVLVNLGQYEYGGAIQAVSGTGYIYNNTIYYSGSENEGTIQFPGGGAGPGGGHPVWYVANNIIWNNVAGSLYLSDGNGNAPTWANFAVLTNNNYYGEGNGPSQDPKPLNANPQFVAAGSNFQLQASSPDINAGYNTISVVASDLNGLVRSATPAIGAYEYSSSTSTPTPVVSITSPTTGSNVTSGSNVSITAAASEVNGTISNISIYSGATLLGSSSSSPYTYVMNDPAVGNYTLTAVATDANGVSTTSSAVSVTVASQSQQPSSPVVTITSPASGSSYTAGSNVTITSTASETNGTISNIYLYNGSGVLLGSSSSSPFSFVDSNMAAGGYSFYAVATDANGVSASSSTITVTITSSASSTPVVSIASPANGTNYTQGSTFTISASASETNGTIAQVQYYSGSYLLATSTTSPYTASWTNATTGTFTLNAKATDANGVSTMSSPITITVTTAASSSPVVAITSPANASSFTAGSNITLTASASETNGSISKVQFYNGSTLLGTSTASPYTFTWNNVAAGNYTLTAKATDANSVSTTSSAITVAVSGLPAVSLAANNSTYTAPALIDLTATASETNGTISKVEFFNGSTLLGTDTSSPYTYAWSNVAVGSYSLTAEAFDNNNNTVTSSTVNVTVTLAGVAPSFTAQPVSSTVTAPAIATFSVAATGTPAPTFQWMQSVNGGAFSAISGATSSTYTTAATTTANSGTEFECVITNASGSVTSNIASLTVNAAPIPSTPTITLTSPSTNSTFTAPATIFLSADASENNGTITQVQFFNGSTLLYTALSAPYSYTWTSNLLLGSYTITAQATDSRGVVVTSAPATITISLPTRLGSGTYAPTVAITSPDNGSTITAGSNLNITANASITYGKIAVVYFYNGSTFLGSSSTSPYNFTWNNVPAGTYSLTAKAVDTYGVSGFSSPVIVTAPSSAPASPAVTIINPANGNTFTKGTNVTIMANAFETPGTGSYALAVAAITQVQFYNGSTLLGTSTTSPYSFNWNNVAAGTYSLIAKATDTNGVSTSSAPVTVIVTTPSLPVVSLTNPVNGGSYATGTNLTISANASEVNGTIAQVQFYNGSTLLGTDTTSPYTYTMSNALVGSYTLTVKATDINGVSVTSSPVSFDVTAVPPTVNITSPANESSLTTGSNLNITANASEVNGTIAQVQFYNGSTLLGSSSTSPYSLSLTNVAAGTYTLTVQATDSNGISTSSSAVIVTVAAPAPVVPVTPVTPVAPTTPSLPTVTLSGITNDSKIMLGTTVPLNVNASEANGSIAQVNIYNGSILIYSSNSSSFNFNWRANLLLGTYNLTAQAIDANGTMVTSAPITVTIGL